MRIDRGRHIGGGEPGVRPGIGRSQFGQSALEFALLLPVLILLVVTAIDLGRAYHAYTSLESAVRVGAGFATTDATSLDAADPHTFIKNMIVAKFPLSPALDVTNVKFYLPGTTTPSTAIGSGVTADIEAKYDFLLITPLARSLVGGDGTLWLRYRFRITYA